MLFNLQDNRRKAIRALLALAAGIVLLPLFSVHAAAGAKIAVLVSSTEPPFEEALEGFQEQLSKQGLKPEYDIHHLKGDASQAEQIVQKMKKNGVKLIFTLGSIATNAAVRAQKTTTIPVVSCLVLHSETLIKTPGVTGVGLEFPLEVQFQWVKTILPDVTTLGVLYNPGENKARIEQAGHIASRMGLRLEAVEVRTPQDVPSALASLAKNADALWGLPDSLILSPQLAKHILLFAFRNNIPFIGPSDQWVKAGALYSLDWDYRDLGAQCGGMAFQIVHGTSPGRVHPAAPRKIQYSINMKTAEYLKLSIPEDILRKARNIY